MDLADYRRSAEEFTSELTLAYYRHYAGLEDEYLIEPVYARHAELFGHGAVLRLQELADAAVPGTDERRRRLMLLDFAAQGYVGLSTKELEAEVAGREAALSIEAGGRQLGFRESAVTQANEPDRGLREEIEQARLAATDEHLNPLYRRLVERQHESARELGYESYRQMCEACKGFDLSRLHGQTSAFSTATDVAYAPVLEPELERTVGIGMAQLRRSDLPRLFRAVEFDQHFDAASLVPSLLDTLRALGIGEQPNVVLDVEPRPKKSPRAFCAPVRVPDEVYLVISPVGGREDFGALFHESGHTEHYAHVDRELPFEFRYLGDNAITECFAFLFEHLTENPAWLERRLGVHDAGELGASARAYRLVYLRRYCAKLAYELELHGGEDPLDALGARYAQLLGDALRVEWPQQTFLADVDEGFYCACYLRAWALETHLRKHLVERFGEDWFDAPAAGDALRELWRDGQRLGPDELLGQLTGERLEFGVLLDDLALRLP